MILRKREIEKIKFGFLKKYIRSDFINILIIVMSAVAFNTENMIAKLVIYIIIFYLFDWSYNVRKKDDERFDQKIKYCYNESQANDTPHASD